MMRFVTVRELRSQSADVWRRLADEPEMVITSNGRPVAILSAVSSEGLEESLAALRRAGQWQRSRPCRRDPSQPAGTG